MSEDSTVQLKAIIPGFEEMRGEGLMSLSKIRFLTCILHNILLTLFMIEHCTTMWMIMPQRVGSMSMACALI